MLDPGMEPAATQPFDEEGFQSQLVAEQGDMDWEHQRKGRQAHRTLDAARKFEQSSFCIFYAMAGDATGLALILFALTGLSWASVSFAGVGVKTMYINTGMYDMEIKVLCQKNWVEDHFCKYASKFHGRESINHFMGLATSVGSHGAAQFGRIQSCSFMLSAFFVWCSFMIKCSVVCAWFYWYRDHNPRWRQRAFFFGIVGPVSFLLALGAWAIFMPNLAHMPNSLVPGGAGWFEFKPVSAPPFGLDFLMAVIGTLILLCTNISLPCYVMTHPDELGDEDARIDRMEALEERLDFAKAGEVPAGYGYGATAASGDVPQGSTAMPGGDLVAAGGGDAATGGEPHP